MTELDLDVSGHVKAKIKISSKAEERTWHEFKKWARESHQNISGLRTEAIEESLARRRVRPEVLSPLQASLTENEELGRLLVE